MKWGKCDFKQFKKLAENFEAAIQDQKIDEVLKALLFELANRVLALTKEKTPVGIYDTGGRVGGHLRRNWFIGDVKRAGDELSIEIYNTVEYALFVEYGHRTRNHKSWVEGRFMLKISMKSIEQMLPKITEQHVKKFLEGLLKV